MLTSTPLHAQPRALCHFSRIFSFCLIERPPRCRLQESWHSTRLARSLPPPADRATRCSIEARLPGRFGAFGIGSVQSQQPGPSRLAISAARARFHLADFLKAAMVR